MKKINYNNNSNKDITSVIMKLDGIENRNEKDIFEYSLLHAIYSKNFEELACLIENKTIDKNTFISFDKLPPEMIKEIKSLFSDDLISEKELYISIVHILVYMNCPDLLEKFFIQNMENKNKSDKEDFIDMAFYCFCLDIPNIYHILEKYYWTEKKAIEKNKYFLEMISSASDLYPANLLRYLLKTNYGKFISRINYEMNFYGVNYFKSIDKKEINRKPSIESLIIKNNDYDIAKSLFQLNNYYSKTPILNKLIKQFKEKKDVESWIKLFAWNKDNIKFQTVLCKKTFDVSSNPLNDKFMKSIMEYEEVYNTFMFNIENDLMDTQLSYKKLDYIIKKGGSPDLEKIKKDIDDIIFSEKLSKKKLKEASNVLVYLVKNEPDYFEELDKNKFLLDDLKYLNNFYEIEKAVSAIENYYIKKEFYTKDKIKRKTGAL